MKLIDKAAVVAEIERQQRKLCVLSQSNEVEFRKKAAIQNGVYCSVLSFLDTLEVKEVNEKSETACRSKIIKVKCISPFDETWEKGKVYTGEKWHHGDLDMDFWDIYYDYGSNPKYVQFSSFEMLEKEFVVLKNDAFEVKEIDLENEIDLRIGKLHTPLHYEELKDFAKHFFELAFSLKK